MGLKKYTFTYDSVTSEALGLVAYGAEGIDEPAVKDITDVVVPGRNGVLHIDNNRWNERMVSYLCYIPGSVSSDYISIIQDVREKLGSRNGYKELSDTIYTGQYTLATFVDAVEAEPMAFRTMGLIKVTFRCRPERFLDTGKTPVVVADGGYIENPTLLPAKPLIKIEGTAAGTVTVTNQALGGFFINISTIDGYVEIDCDTCECRKGLLNCNGDVTVTRFPQMLGKTYFTSWTGGITKVTVTPRWWTL